MRSSLPKPLHKLVGRPLVEHVLSALAGCDAAPVVVVVGHGADAVTKRLRETPISVPLEFVEQASQRGTGDAVAVGLTGLPDYDLDSADVEDGDVIVLPGDAPLLRSATLVEMVEAHRSSGAACTVLTARLADPSGYGRIERDAEGRVRRVVEHREATGEQLAIDEVNTGVYVFHRGLLAPALRRLVPDNSQGELYLTDVVEVLAEAGHKVVGVVAADPQETHGVNDRAQLATAEAELRRRINDGWLRAGVTIVDPATTYIDAGVKLAADVTVWPGSVLAGTTVVESGSQIGPSSQLTDCAIGQSAVVAHTVARRASVGDGAVVGPFAVLEVGTEVPSGSSTGPFYAAEVS